MDAGVWRREERKKKRRKTRGRRGKEEEEEEESVVVVVLRRVAGMQRNFRWKRGRGAKRIESFERTY